MLQQLYSYLSLHSVVRIGELAELFGVHRTTIWRNMRKLEVAGMVRSIRTDEGVQVEICGPWVESVQGQQVTPRWKQCRSDQGRVAADKKVRVVKKGDVASDSQVMRMEKIHVARRDLVKCKARVQVAFSHVASPSSRARIKSFYKYSIPQLVTRTRDLWPVFDLPPKISTAQVRQITAWIRKHVDLPAYLASLGIRVYKRNRAGENPCSCPLHDDRHPSFYANAGKGIWYCHACQIAGDAVELVRRLTGVRFGEAVRRVLRAVKKSVLPGGGGLLRDSLDHAMRTWPLARSETRTSDRIEKPRVMHQIEPTIALLEQKREQGNRYAQALELSGRAKAFLKMRGIEQASVLSFGIGYDEQRNAIAFPTRSAVNGAVLGFTYRSIDPQSGWRYRNTSSDAIYSKGANLYGLYEVKQRVEELGRLFVTEGIFDALHLNQIGQAAVAMQGVHLTDAHVELIRSVLGDVEVILTLDNDRAGEKGNEENLRLLRSKGIRCRLERVPKDYKDVAEFLGEQYSANEEVDMNG